MVSYLVYSHRESTLTEPPIGTADPEQTYLPPSRGVDVAVAALRHWSTMPRVCFVLHVGDYVIGCQGSSRASVAKIFFRPVLGKR